ncbi:hypothetical protein [Paraburkholderia sp. BCC1886]|uniref:hypothetical protein n=1 Tax=Paraburkholderia sp. BCC1886 TaxID=2562670 RepID=UPI0011827670|nr:hypothetical protein [Paraburkholderia sp. BCC1886]
MNKQLINVSKLAAAVGIAFSLSACHSDKPSDSEAKAAFEQAIGDCQYIKLDSFEKVNGVPEGDNGYSVSVKYVLKLQEPDSQFTDKMKEQASLLEDFEPLKQQAAELDNKVLQEENEYTSTHPDDHRELKDMMADNPDVQQSNALNAKVHDMGIKLYQLNNEGTAQWQNTVAGACRSMGSVGMRDVVYQSVSQLLDGTKAEMTATINMVNTDNGWMLAQ